jgi:prolyl oligopeptidase
LEGSRDGRYILASVANGDGGDFAHYLLVPGGSASGEWKQITKFDDQIKAAHLGRDNALYLLSRNAAPRGKVLRLPLETPELSKAVEIVPAGEPVIQQMVPAADALFVGDLLGGPSQIRRFGLDGKGETIIPIPKISAVQEMVSLEDGSLLFRDQSYTEPAAWFHCPKEKTEPVNTALRSTSPVSFADIEVSANSQPQRTARKFRSISFSAKESNGTGRTRHCFTATGVTESACPRILSLRAGFGSITAACMWWRIFEAVASSVKTGTRPAISRKSKTCSTTSPLRRNI